MYFISDFCQQMINRRFLLYSSITAAHSSASETQHRLLFPPTRVQTLLLAPKSQTVNLMDKTDASFFRGRGSGVRWPLVSLLGGIRGQSVRVQMHPRRCLRSNLKYLQTQRVVNVHSTPDECDLLIFSLVWNCHRRLIPRFFKSFETVKQKRALFPVVDQYIANTAGCVWQTNYQRPLLGYACSWLRSKPDVSKPWVDFFLFNIRTYIEILLYVNLSLNSPSKICFDSFKRQCCHPMLLKCPKILRIKHREDSGSVYLKAEWINMVIAAAPEEALEFPPSWSGYSSHVGAVSLRLLRC